MDPLSLIANIFALMTAINATSKGIQRVLALRGASKRLLDVHHKIEELKVLSTFVQRTAESSSIIDQNAVIRFKKLISRAGETIKDAENLIKFKLIKNPESFDDENIKMQLRKVRFVKEENRLVRMSAELSEILTSLSTALNSISAHEILGMRITLTNVQLRVMELHDSNQYLDDRSNARFIDAEDSSIETELLSKISAPELAASIVEAPSGVTSISSHVIVEVMMTEEQPLEAICSCTCHSPLALKTPEWLGNAIGTLLVRWYRSPKECRGCSRRSCKVVRKSTMCTRYYFPWWMMQRFIEFESGWKSSQTLTASLKFARVIPEDSNVFLFAQHNNLAGLKRLFEQRLASPLDISIKGRTPLHFAATAVKAEMIEFLVHQQAETDIEDHDNLTPHDIIWELYLRDPARRGYILTAAGLTPGDTDSLEKQSFTPIHQIVLGLGGTFDLDSYLKISNLEIDKQDLTGKTALAWAASRKDARTIQTLLHHKASVEISDHRKKTPLHYAAGSGVPEAVKMILQSIKMLEEGMKELRSSIIEARDDKGRTPLNYSTRMDLYPHTQLLIAYGANLEATESKTKRSILLNAIYWNSHKILPLLLDHGAKFDVRDATGATILHYIARFGDLKTLEIMEKRRFSSIDSRAVGSSGRTAIDLFNSIDARCRPEEGEERQLAVALFMSILDHATGSKDHGTLIIDLEEGDVEEEEKEGDEADEVELENEEDRVEELPGQDANGGTMQDSDDENDIFHNSHEEFPLIAGNG